jgi:hypothetical protein
LAEFLAELAIGTTTRSEESEDTHRPTIDSYGARVTQVPGVPATRQ